eukprot:TRINITY_DN9295_c0_g1_i2.p1 TRINITY_DN9295_c0_g1~~TRINITY_DN9295_c0_g1_i2.p1  ORF type:complete len:528 (+),score=81.29 TRINITY_DN9295_c0_g1_i2:57-1640(+)
MLPLSYLSRNRRWPFFTFRRLIATTPIKTNQRERSLLSKSVTECVSLLERRETTALELTSACFKRIEETRYLNSFITESIDRAKERAEKVDKMRSNGENVGPLGGIPIAIKDNFCVAGVRTTAGSKMLQDFVPPYDSTVSARLENSGAIVLGKTNMDEFGMGSANIYSYFGSTINPWSNMENPERIFVPGGSSGGSAAAVASHQAFAAVGSDTGGSVRQPASWCGIVGLKPSYGRTSRHGLIAYASSLDTPGLLTKTVSDAALLLDIIAGSDELDSTSISAPTSPYLHSLSSSQSLSDVTIGIPNEYHVEELTDEALNLWKESIDRLSSLGASIKSVSLPHTPYALSAYYIIAPAEASSNLARYDGIRYGYREDADNINDMISNTRTNAFGSEVQRRILIGSFVLSRKSYESYYKKAQQIRRLVVEDFDRAFDSVDVIVAPTTPTTAMTLSQAKSDIENPVTFYLNDVFTVPASMAGLPAVSVPMDRLATSSGLPFGIQVIGRKMGEVQVLRVGKGLEGENGLRLGI